MNRVIIGLMVLMLVPSTGLLAQSRTAYMLRIDTEDADFSHELARLDLTHIPLTNSINPVLPVEIGYLGLEADAACLSPSGELVALDRENDRLLRVDLETGGADVFLSLSFDVGIVGDIAFSGDGELWLASSNSFQTTQIYTVDTDTGDVELIGSTDLWVDRLVFHHGHLYGAGGDRFMEIDPVTANTTLITTYAAPDREAGQCTHL